MAANYGQTEERQMQQMRYWVGFLVLGGLVMRSAGSGFAILEQSGRTMGQALAGAPAQAEDPSGQYFNPALLADQQAAQFSVGAHVIVPSFRFEDRGSSYPGLGLPLRGGNGGNGGVTAFVPNLYYAQPLSADWVAGIGVFAPYGLQTQYDADWVGRYHGIKTDLSTLNINPNLAWRATDRLSLGVGVSAQYAEADLTSAVDFGSILAAAGAPGAAPQGLDGHAQVKGDDWGYGFNLGLAYKLSAETRLGLSYRSQIEHQLKGDARFTAPAAATPLQEAGLFVNTSGQADLTLPEVISGGVAQRVGERFEVLADVSWTRWSRFEELRIEYGSNQPDSVTVENWKNTWRGAVGLKYFYSPEWILRTGLAYDETPIRTAVRRTPRIPDADRRWISVGATYVAAADLSFDAGYTYISFVDSKVNVPGPTGDNLRGKYEGYVNLFSLQMNYTF